MKRARAGVSHAAAATAATNKQKQREAEAKRLVRCYSAIKPNRIVATHVCRSDAVLPLFCSTSAQGISIDAYLMMQWNQPLPQWMTTPGVDPATVIAASG